MNTRANRRPCFLDDDDDDVVPAAAAAVAAADAADDDDNTFGGGVTVDPSSGFVDIYADILDSGTYSENVKNNAVEVLRSPNGDVMFRFTGEDEEEDEVEDEVGEGSLETVGSDADDDDDETNTPAEKAQALLDEAQRLIDQAKAIEAAEAAKKARAAEKKTVSETNEDDLLPEATALKRMTVANLKELLTARGLDTSGRKDDLIKRLEDSCVAAAGGKQQRRQDEEEENDGPPEEIDSMKQKRKRGK